MFVQISVRVMKNMGDKYILKKKRQALFKWKQCGRMTLVIPIQCLRTQKVLP